MLEVVPDSVTTIINNDPSVVIYNTLSTTIKDVLVDNSLFVTLHHVIVGNFVLGGISQTALGGTQQEKSLLLA